MLRGAGLDVICEERFHTVESARNWLGSGSIPADRQSRAMELYRNASQRFLELHALEQQEDDYLDRMLFVLVLGQKREGPPPPP